MFACRPMFARLLTVINLKQFLHNLNVIPDEVFDGDDYAGERFCLACRLVDIEDENTAAFEDVTKYK